MHCKDFALGIGRQLKKDFVDTGQMRFVYRHFAFLGEESFRAAEASECAADQGKFWEYHDVIYENWGGVNTGAFYDDPLIGFAEGLGLDRKVFSTCLTGGKYRDKVEGDVKDGERFGVNSTPTLFVNGRKVQNATSYDDYARLIESELAGAK